MDCCTCAPASLYLRRDGAGDHHPDAIVILRTPVDIFPDINIPVISVVWNYAGFAPSEMADRIVTNSERGITITVNDIEHIESQSVNGVGVIKIFFRPQANIQTALSQVTAIVQTTVRGLPPGTTPPLIITYSASSTPIVQLGLSSKTLARAATVRPWAELPAQRNWQRCMARPHPIPTAGRSDRYK